MIVLKVAILAYYIAINIYGATLLLMQKRESMAASYNCDNIDIINNDNINNIAIADFNANKERCGENKESESSSFEEKDVNTYKDQSDLSKNRDFEKSDFAAKNADGGRCNINNNINKEKKNAKDRPKRGGLLSAKPVSDGMLFLTATLGGSLGMYICLLVMRYRLKNLPLMVGLPVISAVYLSLIVAFFLSTGIALGV